MECPWCSKEIPTAGRPKRTRHFCSRWCREKWHTASRLLGKSIAQDFPPGVLCKWWHRIEEKPDGR